MKIYELHQRRNQSFDQIILIDHAHAVTICSIYDESKVSPYPPIFGHI